MTAPPAKPALPLAEMLHSPEAGIARLLETINRRDKTRMRQALIAGLRQLLDEGHASARTILAGPRGGLACAHRLSAVMDAVVRGLHSAAVTYFYPADNPSQSERIAVVAVGGYGRGTLAPGWMSTCSSCSRTSRRPGARAWSNPCSIRSGT